jgi:hypothetical protein
MSNNSVKPQNELSSNAYGHSSSLKIENRRFTYKELDMITSNFQRMIGRGGFGKVYDGFLEDGTQVAVKLRYHSSNQGDREFLAEVVSLEHYQIQTFVLKIYSVNLILLACLGSDINTDSSQVPRFHDRLLQGWGVHGTCLRVHVRRNPARAYSRYVNFTCWTI